VITAHDLGLALSKGPWIYHMLRRRVGDALFFDTLQKVVEAFPYREIDMDRFRALFIEAAPEDADLERFFQQWLDRPGAPVIDMTWMDVSREDRFQVEVRLVQDTEPYRLHLDLAVDTPEGVEVKTVLLTDREQVFLFDLPAPPLEVRLDPNHDLLLWKDEYGPRPGSALSRFYGAIGR
jgi:aminopeptidase N